MTTTTLPTVTVDTREKLPLAFRHLPSAPGTLQSGDYSIAGMEADFAVERKSVSDLLGSVTRDRDRFERELHRLRGFSFARLLIVGRPAEIQTRAPNPKTVFSTLGAFEARWTVPVYWCATPESAALAVERWAWFFWRERVRSFLDVPACPIPWDVGAGIVALV